MKIYQVMTACAKMPGKCWGRYGKVAVVKTDGIHMPKQINPTHKAVKEIVAVWDRMHRGYGNTGNTAFDHAENEAWDLCDELNRRHEILFRKFA